MRRSTKASMQLSINAIVILVMAMAVLGIGLGLIRGVLAPAQTNLEEALGKVDLDEVATSSNPVANIPKTINMKKTGETQLAISYYNSAESCSDDDAATFKLVCAGTSGNEVDVNRKNFLEIDVDAGSAQTLIATFTPSDGANADELVGTVPCKVQVVCGTDEVESKAAFINFNS